MLVDCFLSLWFRGLINLGEYSEGKATRNRALVVYKSGALRSVNMCPYQTLSLTQSKLNLRIHGPHGPNAYAVADS